MYFLFHFINTVRSTAHGEKQPIASRLSRERERRKKQEKCLAKGLERKREMFYRLLYRLRTKTISIMIIFVQLLKSQMHGNSICTETVDAGSRPISDLGLSRPIPVSGELLVSRFFFLI